MTKWWLASKIQLGFKNRSTIVKIIFSKTTCPKNIKMVDITANMAGHSKWIRDFQT